MMKVSKDHYEEYLKQFPDAEVGIHSFKYLVHHYAEQVITAQKGDDYYINEYYQGTSNEDVK